MNDTKPVSRIAEFTAGPWEQLETESSVLYEYIDGSGVSVIQGIGPRCGDAVAAVFSGEHCTHAEFDANCSLIAAAPDMYASLEEIASPFEGLPDVEVYEMTTYSKAGQIIRARQALSRARGETK